MALAAMVYEPLYHLYHYAMVYEPLYEPIKSLELHYTMIQFLIIVDISSETDTLHVYQ